ncbi:MAG: transglycosylase SLT domain-containing protein [Bacillaceae bacterium]|nr:transglycosylase SLT domain-containing protein [Bacillaceae bacterium]
MTACFILVYHVYAKKTDDLRQENQALRDENQVLESQNHYLKSLPTQFKTSSWYKEFPEMDKMAGRMVDESGGKFKRSWAIYLIREAKRYDIDPFLVYELLRVETGGTFNPELVGPPTAYGRAYGLAQFMKNTAPWIAEMAGLPYEDDLLFDPYYSMQLSLVYLDFLYHEYGNWNEALTAYHRGMGGLEQYKKEHGHARSWYAVKIQQNARSHESYAFAE